MSLRASSSLLSPRIGLGIPSLSPLFKLSVFDIRNQSSLGSFFQLHGSSFQSFSSTPTSRSYDDTFMNMMLTKDTKVICQGFTGKQVTKNTLTWLLTFFPFLYSLTFNFPSPGLPSFRSPHSSSFLPSLRV